MENITVLLPGGFKPPHIGHLGLANKFASNSKVKKVIVMIGPSERDGINRQKSLTVWNLLPTNPKVEIVSVTEDNPMNAAFNYVFNLPKNSNETVALGASSKSPEDAKRSQIFVAAIDRYKNKSTKDGKVAPKGVKAINMTDDVPSNYVGRTDEKNGKSISASVLRHDLMNNDFENFKTNYPGIKTGIVKSIYNILKRQSESTLQETIKRKLKNIIINILKEDEGRVKSATKKAYIALQKQREEELRDASEKLKTAKEKVDSSSSPEDKKTAEDQFKKAKELVDSKKDLVNAAKQQVNSA